MKFLSSGFRLLREHPAYCGLCVVALAEGAMNVSFGFSRSQDVSAQVMLAALFGGSELVKWKAGEAMAEAVHAAETAKGWACALVLMAALSISLPAHIGFIGLHRGDVAASRDTQQETRATAKQQLDQARKDRADLGTVRSPEQVKVDLDNTKKDTAKWDRLQAELAKANQARVIDGRLLAAETKLGGVASVGTADPQVAVLLKLFGGKAEDLSLWLSIALAIAAELITSLGWFALAGAKREKLDLETLLTQGAITHPGAAHILPFRAEALEPANGEQIGCDELFAAYEAWCRRTDKESMSRGAFLRLIEALGVTRREGRFVNVRVRNGWLLRAAA
jgi:hypothetical protein